MPKRVEIIKRAEIFKKFIFRIEEVTYRHETFNGTLSGEITRVNLDRGDSVAAVVHDTQRETLILTEQFRIATHDKGPGWLLEIPAGMVEPGEDPAAAMRRELEEEIGYQVTRLQPISTFYLSPGGISERILLYYAQVRAIQRVTAGGGVALEGEDIRVVTLPLPTAFEKLRDGTIVDAKTIIGLQWLQLRR